MNLKVSQVFRRCLLLAAFTLAACEGLGPSQAGARPSMQMSPEHVFGVWLLRSSATPQTCRIALSRFGQSPYLVQIERCEIKSVSHAVHWRPTATGFELLDPDGAILLAFRALDMDAFDSLDGNYQLRRRVIVTSGSNADVAAPAISPALVLA